MKNPFVYGWNLLKVCIWKIRYPKKLSIGPIQSFEKVRFELSGNCKAKIGNFNQNREKLYVRMHNGNLTIGNHCFFNINSSITCLKEVEIGDNCKFGNNLVIIDHDHNFRSSTPEFLTGSIKIGNNVWVGANVTILRDTVIGDNCVIAAGSVVKGNIESGYLVLGNVKNLKPINNHQ